MLLVDWLCAVLPRSRDRRLRAAARRGRERRQMWRAAAGIERLEDRTLLSNMAPITYPDSYSFDFDTLDTSADGEMSVLANDADYDGPEPLTAELVSGPSHGSLTFYSNGHFIYEAEPGFSGTDAFTYRAFDGLDYTEGGASLEVTKPLSAAQNLEDRPSAPATPFGPFAASAFTGDVQVVQPIGGGLTLQYHALSDPRPVLGVESIYTPGDSSPSGLEATLTFDSTAAGPVYYDGPGEVGTFRFAMQADAASLDTGRYGWEIELLLNYTSGKTASHLFNGTAEIVNLSDSVFGAGWTISQIDRLVAGTGGMLYVSGTGLTGWFAEDGNGGFISPAGPLTTYTLVENQDGTFALSDKYGNDSNYSAAGLLTTRVDRNGNSTAFAYIDADSDGQADDLDTVTDPFGRVVADLAYTNGLLSSVTDQAGRVTTLGHDASARLTSITRPDPDTTGPQSAPVTGFSYEGTSFRLTTITDPLNRQTSLAYDFAGRIQEATFADLQTQGFTAWQTRGLPDLSVEGTPQNPAPLFYASSMLATVTDPLDRTSEYHFDRFGFVTFYSDPLGNVTTWQRNSDGLATVLTQPDADGAGSTYSALVTQFQYDQNQNLTQITFADSTTQSWVFDTSLNQPTSFTDELGRTTDYTLSATGNVLTVTLPAPEAGAARPVTTYSYTTRGFIETVTLPDPDATGPRVSPVTEFQRDQYGRVVTIVNPDLTTIQQAWDTADRLTSRTDELSRVTAFVWDDLDRLVETRLPDPDGAGGPLAAPVYAAVYDAFGNVVLERNAAGNEVTHEYDSRNRRFRTTLPDPDGDPNSGQPAPVWQWSFNAASELTAATDPLSNVTSYGRDGAGRVTSITTADPDGEGPLSAATTTYTLDNLGRVQEVTDALGGKTTFLFDERSRVIERRDPDPDGAGSLPRPVWTFGFTAAGELSSISDPLLRVTSFERDGLGRVTRTLLPDPDGDGIGQPRPVYETVFDALSNVLIQRDPLGNEVAFSYDIMSRVLTRTGEDPDGAGPLSAPVTTYSWTATGMLSDVTDALGRTVTTTFDNLERPITRTMAYPSGGGPGQVPVWSWQYDVMSRVVVESDPNGNSVQHTYDNLSRRSSTTLQDPDGAGPLSAPVYSWGFDLMGNVLSETS
ncbi:MAG TPA: Ig-like domain-containing protein, partial [Planctomycetaceae bacterium]|nr:Ig-like domain-containing protein [Planctomycetaceae bacterium]